MQPRKHFKYGPAGIGDHSAEPVAKAAANASIMVKGLTARDEHLGMRLEPTAGSSWSGNGTSECCATS